MTKQGLACHAYGTAPYNRYNATACPMNAMTARVPHIDWSVGLDRSWIKDNAPASHAFDAFSFMLPQTEHFFADTVRQVLQRELNSSLSNDVQASVSQDTALIDSARSFIAQESIHHYQHRRYNTMLEQNGLRSVVDRHISWLQRFAQKHLSSLTRLALVSGYEHYTAMLSVYILARPELLASATPHVALLWGWHAAEECEHEAVCVELYRRLGGGWARRVACFTAVTLELVGAFSVQYLSLLWQDACLRPGRLWKTASQAARLFFARSGFAWFAARHALAYLNPAFHPRHANNISLASTWLAKHQAQLREVSPSRSAVADAVTPSADLAERH